MHSTRRSAGGLAMATRLTPSLIAMSPLIMCIGGSSIDHAHEEGTQEIKSHEPLPEFQWRLVLSNISAFFTPHVWPWFEEVLTSA